MKFFRRLVHVVHQSEYCVIFSEVSTVNSPKSARIEMSLLLIFLVNNHDYNLGLLFQRDGILLSFCETPLTNSIPSPQLAPKSGGGQIFFCKAILKYEAEKINVV